MLGDRNGFYLFTQILGLFQLWCACNHDDFSLCCLFWYDYRSFSDPDKTQSYQAFVLACQSLCLDFSWNADGGTDHDCFCLAAFQRSAYCRLWCVGFGFFKAASWYYYYFLKDRKSVV